MKKTVLALVVTCAVTGSANAQDPVRVGMRVGDPASTSDVIVGYDSGGRRDPFVSLVVPRRPVPTQAAASGPRRTGLGALALADTKIRGVVRHGDQMLAIAEGPDDRSFVLHLKDRLFDAEVKSIDAQGVVFVELVDGATGRAPREIRKALRPAAEGGIR